MVVVVDMCEEHWRHARGGGQVGLLHLQLQPAETKILAVVCDSFPLLWRWRGSCRTVTGGGSFRADPEPKLHDLKKKLYKCQGDMISLSVDPKS